MDHLPDQVAIIDARKAEMSKTRPYENAPRTRINAIPESMAVRTRPLVMKAKFTVWLVLHRAGLTGVDHLPDQVATIDARKAEMSKTRPYEERYNGGCPPHVRNNSMVNKAHNRHRHSIRLKDYDYTQPGAYFVTLCVDDRQLLLGEISGGIMHLNRMGLIVQKTWLDLPRHYPQVVLDAMVIMPNHVHAVIVLTDDAVTHKKRHGLPEIVRAFKSFSARRINALRRTPGQPVWQRNYYEHIVRNEDEWEDIRAYIENNPQEWDQDLENPSFPRRGGS